MWLESLSIIYFLLYIHLLSGIAVLLWEITVARPPPPAWGYCPLKSPRAAHVCAPNETVVSRQSNPTWTGAAAVPLSPAAAFSCASNDACLVPCWTDSENTTNKKKCNTFLPISAPCRVKTSTSVGARDGVGIYMMQSKASASLVWISLNNPGTTLQAGLANACYLKYLCWSSSFGLAQVWEWS